MYKHNNHTLVPKNEVRYLVLGTDKHKLICMFNKV